MTDPILHTRRSWLAYGLLIVYVYMLNAAGPVSNYLRIEFGLSYSMSSIHASAFALGMVLTGLFGGRLLQKLSLWTAMAVGTAGLGISGLLLTLFRSPYLTVLSLFFMGAFGTIVLAAYPSILDEEMGRHSAVGISEANTLASLFASLAPLAIGFFAQTSLTWRPAIWIAAGAALLPGVLLLLRRQPKDGAENPPDPTRGSLPLRFWLLWVVLTLSVSIEFCAIYWSAEFMRISLALPAAQATQAVSLFLLGMVVGRYLGGHMLKKISAWRILSASILMGALGFVLFWTATMPAFGLAGLVLLGLGVANLYPVTLGVAIKSAGSLKDLAGARCTLASGTAILLLPFLLGLLADLGGLDRAFLLIAGLFVVLALVLVAAYRLNHTPESGGVQPSSNLGG